MENKKAIVCTVLLTIVMISVLIVAYFIEGEKTGINLHCLLMYTFGIWWLGERIEKFYKWLIN